VTDDELLTTRECAAFLKVHEKTLSRFRRDRSHPLPCVRLRSRVRYRKRDVLAWLSAQERRADL
jgi:excisionase family DNA binding protein